MVWLGEIVGFLLLGGLVWGYAFGWVAGRFLFKNAEPNKKALYVGLIAIFAILMVVVIGLRSPYAFLIVYASGLRSPYAALFYIPGAVAGILLLRRDYRKAWVPEDDTFD